MKLERLLKEKNALVYLCGHKHVNLFRKVETEVKDKPLWEILCGTNMDSAPSVEQTEMSVYVGTLDTTGNCGYIDAYKWSRRNEAWMPDSEFSHRENGALDGRFYFPNREINLSTEASNRYIEYLRKTYTDIQLDGLPADNDVGSRRFPLDSLYVPARFRRRITVNPTSAGRMTAELAPKNTEPCNSPFETKPHAVILAGPGCGKSTYMKKIISDHVSGVCDDKLYPLLIRCRSLNERTDISIMGILQDLPGTSEFPMNASLRQAFCDMVCAKLQLGGILLLLDGLDEITDSVKRSQFIKQLDTFRSTYPSNRILITSRFAGYDDYTKSSLSEFEVCELDDFSDNDIQSLCINWHHVVINNTVEITTKALELADTIIDHDRIKPLAKNPLLLTTLLLVQRRVGRLPTKRAALYEEAIKVLLETWNQEGHAPLNLDISTCKLAYIAYRMSCRGINQITREELLEYLYSARQDVNRKLSYDTISPEDFLKRTEQRSSILIRVGFKTDEQTGKLHEIYEFQHLTFQEYLTAVAVKEKYYPGAVRRDRVIDTLKKTDGLNAFDSGNIKKEVILLTAAVIGWDAEDIALYLLAHITDVSDVLKKNPYDYTDLGYDLLLDEVELEKETQYTLMCKVFDARKIGYIKLYRTDLRELAANIVMDKALDIPPDVFSFFAPWWKMTFEDYTALVLRFHNDVDAIKHIFLLSVSIEFHEPSITEGLLMLCATFYHRLSSSWERDTPTTYTCNLLSRLKEYRSQHPEIKDLSARITDSKNEGSDTQ